MTTQNQPACCFFFFFNTILAELAKAIPKLSNSSTVKGVIKVFIYFSRLRHRTGVDLRGDGE